LNLALRKTPGLLGPKAETLWASKKAQSKPLLLAIFFVELFFFPQQISTFSRVATACIFMQF
jgi:hypothetical protein